MEIRNFIIGIIMFSLVITGIAYVVHIESQYYDVNITDPDWNSSYSKLTEMYGETESYKGEMTAEEETGTNVASGLTRLTKGAGSLLLLPWRAFDFMFGEDGILGKFARDFGIPQFIIDGTVAIAVIIIVFAIVSAVLRWNT